jgi:hypothetical protein
MTHPLGARPGYRQTPLSAEEKARGEANFAPVVAGMLVAGGWFRVSADTPDQVELFQGVARRVSDMLQRPVVSYANGREIVITFGQEQAPALALRVGVSELRCTRRGPAARRWCSGCPLALRRRCTGCCPGSRRGR